MKQAMLIGALMGLSTAEISPYKMKLFKDNGINVDRLFDQMRKHHTIGGPYMDRARATSHYRKYGNTRFNQAKEDDAEEEKETNAEEEEEEEEADVQEDCEEGEDCPPKSDT